MLTKIKAIAKTFGGLLYFFLVAAAVQTFVFIFAMQKPFTPENATDKLAASVFPLAALIYSIIQSGTFISYALFRRRKQTDYIAVKVPAGSTFLYIPFIACLLLFVSSLFSNLLVFLAKNYAFFQSALEEYNNMILQKINPFAPITILSVVILVPIAEELFFRAMVIGELKRFFSLPTVCFISACLFALAHWNWLQSAYTFVAGLILAAVYVWTDSIFYSILLHGFFNLLGSMLPYWINQLNFADAEVIFNLLIILFAVVGYVYLRKLYRNYRHLQDLKSRTSENESFDWL